MVFYKTDKLYIIIHICIVNIRIIDTKIIATLPQIEYVNPDHHVHK